ncbi:hypothetical protein HMPREF9466_02639 [Fusobacterium necrophorum subsp. funduliforme 1_1_36S]|nr:hypothetical protein HMPREF9466_02639 [Fusobacterium necrophorum subsp. funduliforme 1_1_36S]
METKIHSSFGAATRTSSEQSSCHSKGFRAIFTLHRGLPRGRIYRLGYKKLFFSLQEKHAESTVHRKLSSIKVFLRFLKEENIVEEDFSLYLIKVRKEEDVILFFETSVWEKFRKSFEEDIRDRAIFELLYSTGMKPKEFLSLSYMQIHWEKQEIYFFQKKKQELFFLVKERKRLFGIIARRRGFEREIFGISQRRLCEIFL